MNEVIAGYRCLTPMQTAGSGSARWCIASRGLQRYFLKEFLAPVYPARTDTPLGRRQLERCQRFEERKQRLYASASCVIGDVLVPVIDFFRSDGHYYAVSEAVPEGCLTAEEASRLTNGEKRTLLYELAVCLQRLHAQGVVHADLKPEHILLIRKPDGWRTQLIDLDSGFLAEDPPKEEQEMEGDPAYLAPEMFLRMVGEAAPLGAALDTFAFGMLIHQVWTGELPVFDRTRYHYLYEAVLEGADIRLNLPQAWQQTVRQMLCAAPAERPSDVEVAALFVPEKAAESERPRLNNGLRRLMKV